MSRRQRATFRSGRGLKPDRPTPDKHTGAEGRKSLGVEDISEALYTASLPDPDLVIRTSGEMRLSHFLLWQSAYAELYVTPVLWPDFQREHLVAALTEFQRRERRFGGR